MKSYDLSIAPVAKGTFKGLKVSFGDLARKFRTGTVTCAERHNPDGTVTAVFLVGKMRDDAVGKMFTVGNAVNQRPYGEHFVTGVISFSMNRGFLELDGIDVGTTQYSDIADLEAVVFELKA